MACCIPSGGANLLRQAYVLSEMISALLSDAIWEINVNYFIE
jgi:hypothetical protein